MPEFYLHRYGILRHITQCTILQINRDVLISLIYGYLKQYSVHMYLKNISKNVFRHLIQWWTQWSTIQKFAGPSGGELQQK